MFSTPRSLPRTPHAGGKDEYFNLAEALSPLVESVKMAINHKEAGAEAASTIRYHKPPGVVPTIDVGSPGSYPDWSVKMRAYMTLAGMWAVIMFQVSQMATTPNDSMFQVSDYNTVRACASEHAELAFSLMSIACQGATRVILGRYQTNRNSAELWLAIREYCLRVDPSRMFEAEQKIYKIRIKTDGTLTNRIRKYLRDLEAAIQKAQMFDPTYEPNSNHMRLQALSEIRKIPDFDNARIHLEDVTDWQKFQLKLERYAHVLSPEHDGKDARLNKAAASSGGNGQDQSEDTSAPKSSGKKRAQVNASKQSTPADWSDKSKPCGLPGHSGHSRSDCIIGSKCERCGAIEHHAPQKCLVNPMNAEERKEFYGRMTAKYEALKKKSASANTAKPVSNADGKGKVNRANTAKILAMLASIAGSAEPVAMPSYPEYPGIHTANRTVPSAFAVIDSTDARYSTMCLDSGATHAVLSHTWVSQNEDCITDMPKHVAEQFPNRIGAWNGSTGKISRWVYCRMHLCTDDNEPVCPVCIPALVPESDTSLNLLSTEVLVHCLAVQVVHDREGMRLKFDDGATVNLSKQGGLYHCKFTPQKNERSLSNQLIATLIDVETSDAPDTPAESTQSFSENLSAIYQSLHDMSDCITAAKAALFVRESNSYAKASLMHGVSRNYLYLKAVTGFRNDRIVDYVGRKLGIQLTGRDRTAMGMPNPAQRALGASRRHPDPPSVTTARAPGELISQDPIELRFRMIGGCRVIYFTVDRGTNMIRPYFAEAKTSANAIKAFETFFNASNLYESASHGPAIVQTDSDSIYKSKEYRDMLNRRNITARYGTPYHHRSDWACEKYIGIIAEQALTMLFAPLLLQLGRAREALFGLAVEHACLLHSVFPTTGNTGNMTPHTAETGEDSAPLLEKYLRAPFGSPGYVNSDKDYRGHKLDFRSRYGLFVGIATDTNNCLKMYMPDTQRIVITPDVLLNVDPSVFNETHFLPTDNEIFTPFTEEPPPGARTAEHTPPPPFGAPTIDVDISTDDPTAEPPSSETIDVSSDTEHLDVPNVSSDTESLEHTDGITAEPISDNTLQIFLPTQVNTATPTPVSNAPPFHVPVFDFCTPDPAISIFTSLGLDAEGVRMLPNDADFGAMFASAASRLEPELVEPRIVVETGKCEVKPQRWDSAVTRAYAAIATEINQDLVESLSTTTDAPSTDPNGWVNVTGINPCSNQSLNLVSATKVGYNEFEFTCQIGNISPQKIPNTYAQSQDSNFEPCTENRKGWHDCTVDEMNGIERIVEITPPNQVPPETKVINTRIVYRIKYDQNGKILKFKARCVAQGFLQRQWYEYGDNSSSVPSMCSTKLFFAHVCERDMDCIQIDVTQAFLGADLDTTIYVRFGDDIPGPLRGQVAKCNGALYGLKQANKCFITKRDRCIKSKIQATQSKVDPNIFVKNYDDGHQIILLCYCDDIAIASTKGCPHVEQVLNDLKSEFEITGGDPIEWFLNMKITRDRSKRTLELTQTAYIDHLIKGFFGVEPDQVKRRDTPFDANYYPTLSDCPQSKEDKDAMSEHRAIYRSTTASLLWYLHTRPDIHFNVTQLCRFVSNPGQQHWNLLKSLLRYCAGTRSRGIKFDASSEKSSLLHAYCDSDWGKCKDTRRSVTGYSVHYCGGPIIAKSHIQKLVAMSTCEAELIALSTAAQTVVWARRLLSDFTGVETTPPCDVYCDNQSAIAVSESEMMSWRNRHIPLRYFKVREMIKGQLIKPVYIRSQDNHSDIMTKQLPKTTLLQHALFYST